MYGDLEIENTQKLLFNCTCFVQWMMRQDDQMTLYVQEAGEKFGKGENSVTLQNFQAVLSAINKQPICTIACQLVPNVWNLVSSLQGLHRRKLLPISSLPTIRLMGLSLLFPAKPFSWGRALIWGILHTSCPTPSNTDLRPYALT